MTNLRKRSLYSKSESYVRLFKKANKMAANAIYRARKNGLPHDSIKTLREECLRQFIKTNGRCPYLYKRYSLTSKAHGGPGDCSPTLDKQIPELGYVIGNIEVISHLANTIKQNVGSHEVRAVADAMEMRGL